MGRRDFSGSDGRGRGYFKSEDYSILNGKRLPCPAVREPWNEVRT